MEPRPPFLRYLSSRRHIVGSLAALAGLGLYFGGLIGPGWWAILAGLYAAGALLTPPGKADRLAQARWGEENLKECLEEMIRLSRFRVPAEAGHMLEAIQGHALLLVPKLRELTQAGKLSPVTRHEAVQALTHTLPATLAMYMRLPASYKELQGEAGGQTPQTLLITQLRQMEENLRQALKEAYAEDVAKLEAQGRFLQEQIRLQRP